MKKQILLFLFFGVNGILFSQSTYFDIVETSGVPKTRNSSSVEAVYITQNEEVAVAYKTKKKLYFNMYDGTGKEILEKFQDLQKKEYVIGHVKGNMTLKVFTVAKPSKTERHLRCHVLNLTDRSLKSQTLFSTTVEKKQALFSGQNKRQTNFSVSPNGVYLAIATDNIKRNSNSYNVHVFNAHTLDLLFEKKFFENPENFFKSFDMSIDDNGHIFSVGKEYKEGRREKTGDDPNYDIVLHKISENDNSSSHIQLNENQHIADLKIVLKENRVDLYGFYSEKRAGRITGISKIAVDKENIRNYNMKQTKLPNTVLKDIYAEEKAEQKKKKELKNYYLDYVLEDEFGNTTLLAEEFFITQTYVNNGQNGGFYMTTFHYNNILIVNLNDRGDVVWGRSILKAATRPSYNAFISNDKLHVLLNTGKALKKKKDGRIKAKQGFFQSSALFDYVYETNGSVIQEKLRDNKGKSIYQPRNGAFQNGKFIMLNSSESEKSLIILNQKD